MIVRISKEHGLAILQIQMYLIHYFEDKRHINSLAKWSILNEDSLYL